MAALALEEPTMSTRQRASAGPTATALRFSRRALAVLVEAGSQFEGALTVANVVERIPEFVVPELADWFVLALREFEAAPRIAGYGHLDPTAEHVLAMYLEPSRTAESSALALLADAVDGRTTWLPSVDWEDVPVRAGSAVCVPLTWNGVNSGALLLVRSASGAYDSSDVDLAFELGRRIASVLETARSFESARAACSQADEMLAVAAHELRTPVAVLSGYSQLLQRQLQGGDPVHIDYVQSTLARIDGQSRRLAMLVSNILESARESGGRVDFEPHEVDLCRVVRTAVELFQVARPDRCIRLDVAQPIRATVDVGRTEQVLSNLLDNAAKFSARETTIDVSVQRTLGGTARVSVRDHGPGVPYELRERIFERFVQAPSALHSEGLGLGLYVSRAIVEQHGGSLNAQFPADGGSRFIVELPCALGESNREEVEKQC